MRCSSCRRTFRPRAFNKGSLCPPCWRFQHRGPEIKSLFKLFELLLTKPGTVSRAASFLGVSRSTLHRWREGHADPRAEGVLALDAFVRAEVYLWLAERAGGRQPPTTKPKESLKQPEPSRRVVPQPEIAAKDVFRTIPQVPVLPAGVCESLRYSAGR
jgi:transposase-like protein